VNPGDWRDEAKKAADKEVIINGVCVMNQSSDFKSDCDDVNMENENGDESDAKSTAAEGNDEDEIKKSFIKKPSLDKSESGEDVRVKKEVDESSAWEY
jgi:hypothetical protein